jgi:hypothetical protein
MAPELGKPLVHLPLIPVDVLERHRVHIPADTRFRSAARLLQALYREECKLPIGSYRGEDGARHKLGSRIALKAGNAGANFLSEKIAYTARRELAYRERGAMYETERLACNLLSSMPLAFNLFAPWAHELLHASSALNELFPIATADARRVVFEHSPDRGNPKFTGDYSAFDFPIEYVDSNGCPGFVAGEVKFTEAMLEPVPDMLRPRYAELAESSGLFIDHAAEALRKNPLQQLFREHLLAQSLLDNRLYQEGYFAVIAPALNYHVWEALALYRTHLREVGEGKVRFNSFTLETLIETIRLCDPDHANALHSRYADWWRIDREIENHVPTFGLSKRTRKTTPEWP